MSIHQKADVNEPIFDGKKVHMIPAIEVVLE